MSVWVLLLILLSLLAVLAIPGVKRKRKVAKHRYAKETTPYGPVYAELYDAILWDPGTNTWEVDTVRERADRSSHVLDVGCGTGHLVAALSKYTDDVVGIDSAPAMLDRARKRFPEKTFVEADGAGSSETFHRESFSHVVCFGNTIFYMQRKDLFFSNAARWLKPGGILILGTGGKHGTVHPFSSGDVSYRGRWENERTYVETIHYKGVRRTVKHTFYPETEATIQSIAKNSGFILEERFSKDNGSVFVFRKQSVA
jgi:SAM-dependent methyltransferase